MKIRKVVIPVAGLGTRLLPTTKALPKEMLPVGRLPVIQHVVEEMAAAGLTKLLFVTSRSKTIIENQFDNNTDIVRHLDERFVAHKALARQNGLSRAAGGRRPGRRLLSGIEKLDHS